MKTLATLIYILVSFISNAQTSLDRKVFDKVNEYRVSIHIPKLEWDSCAYKAAEFQSTYLKSANGLLSHDNPNKGYESTYDRYKMFGGISKETKISDGVSYHSVGEITNSIVRKEYLATTKKNKSNKPLEKPITVDTKKSIKNFFKRKDKLSEKAIIEPQSIGEMLEETAAYFIVDAWKSSSDHKEIMTSKKLKFAGCSTAGYEMTPKDIDKWNKEKQIFEKKKGYVLTGISVMVLVN